MAKILMVAFLSAAALAAQAPAGTGTTVRKMAAKSIAPQAITIPADAKANPDGTYFWTDKEGKKWIYSKTPFGVIKSAASALPDGAPSLAGVKAFDAGDTVRFQKASPFGDIKWEKKKSELTDDERRLLANQSATPNAKQD